MGKNSSLRREQLWLLKDKYAGKPCSAFFSDIERLPRGEPLPYIIGWVPFLDASIKISRGTLIPRVETEYWTEKAILEIKEKYNKKIRVLDMFSGSGCIGISVLKALPNAHVTLSDKYEYALSQIAENLRHNEIRKTQFEVVQSDFLDNIYGSFDVVLANPPYLSKKRVKKIDTSVLLWEPLEALFAEKDGLNYLFMLIENFKKILKKNGTLYIEHDPWQVSSLKKKVGSIPNISYEFIRDQFGKERVLKISPHV